MPGNLYKVHVQESGGSGEPVRLRVLLVHHEPWWDQEDLLPSPGLGFFVQVLREAADGFAGRPSGPLGRAISLEQSLDTSWVETNESRFVERVERTAVRNHPVDDDLVAFYRNNYDMLDRLYYASTYNGGYRPEEHGSIEEHLVQADYAIWVTDPRWTQTLKSGQCWGTDAWGPLTSAGEASASLASELRGSGNNDGATVAYGRAIELGDARTRVEARLDLDDLLNVRGNTDGWGDNRSRAALELCVRLNSAGLHEDARAAYCMAVFHGFPNASIIAEARRRADMECPAEYGHRLAAAGDLSRAAAELRSAYDDGSACIAAFGLAVYEGDFARVEQTVQDLDGDLVIGWAGEVAIDLAFLYARIADDDTVERLLDLVAALDLYGSGGSLLAYALDSGSAHPPELAMEIGSRILEPLVNPARDGEVEAIVETARYRLPELARLACRLQIACEHQYGQREGEARWSARLAEIEGGTR